MRLYHNMASINLYANYSKNVKNQSSSMERISSGLKVSSAKDNPNTLGQSEQLRIQIRGAQIAQRNLQDGASMMQTVDGGLASITDALQRMKELITQSGTGGNAPSDKSFIQTEINALKDHINTVAQDTAFNGVKLLNDTKVIDNANPGMLNMQAGANVGEKIEIPTFNISTDKLNVTGIDVSDSTKMSSNMLSIDNALKEVLGVRSKYGAIEQTFETSVENIDATGVMLQKSDSNLRDADVASEMIKLSSSELLVQAGNAMMAQSNKFPQDVLRILERMR